MRALPMFRQRLTQLGWIYRHFGGLLRSERSLLLLALLALAGEIAGQVLAPWSLKYVTDGLLMPTDDGLPLVPDGYPQAHPYRFLAWVCGGLLAITVVGQWCAFKRTVVAATAGQRMVTKLRKRLYHHLHLLPLPFHQRSRFGDLLLRITGDIPMLRDILSQSLLELVGRMLHVIVVLALMFVLDATLACISLGVFVVLVVLSTTFTRKISRVVRKQRRKEAALAFAAGETLRAVALVKAYGREEEVARSFARQNRSTLRAGLKGTRLQASLARWVEITFAIGTASVLAAGVVRHQQTAMSIGDLLLFLSYVRGLAKPLRKMSTISGRIGKAAACGERVLEVLDQVPEEKERGGGDQAPTLRGEIEFRDVHFSYDDRAPALRGVSFRIGAGQKVALVGRNGAGKSTMVQLLLRFFDPGEGVVALDGIDSRRWTLRSLRERITVVLQETFLFGSTVRENVHFAAPDASDEVILRTLDALGGEFVRELPKGLDAKLREAAQNLSGGERRKILLAGALLRHSPILVLDEPTANIDAGTRRDLVERLPALTAGRTALMITHDPEMLGAVDQVLWLEEGRILAAGPHEELLRTHPAYRALFEGRGGELAVSGDSDREDVE